MDRRSKRTKSFWHMVVVLLAGALVLAACSSASGSTGDEAGSAFGPTSDELNTIAVTERFGPSTAALSVVVAGEQQVGNGTGRAGGVRQSAGSAFIIELDDERFLVTNFHVVESTLEPGTSNLVENASITAVFGEDGESATSLDVVGVNPSFDLALLEPSNAGELPDVDPIPVADSDAVQIGQKTIAIGNPFGLGATVTTGIVSSTGRFVESAGGVNIPMIQTDAAINPGNSGGALLNSSGELIGVNTSIISPGDAAASAGIGFAVPSNLLVESLVNLEDGGVSMVGDTRPAFGARLGNIAGLPPAVREEAGLPDSGIAVLGVDPEGAAAAAGLRVPEFVDIGGIPIPVDPDIIVALNGEPLGSADELTEMVTFGADLGDEVILTIIRNGEELEVTVSLS